jgi:large subunit ribosomal protein L9
MGDVVKVADGYGRNYLVPTKKAIEATPKNVHAMDHAKKMVSDRIRKMKKEATVEADKIKSVSVLIKVKTGEEGKLFGAVTSKDIAEAVQAQGVQIDKRIGDYTVTVKLHTDITADIKVSVVAEE